MPGRKPVPIAIRIARGNPRQHKIPDDNPAPSVDVDLAVPSALKGDRDAAREWKDKAPMLHRLGLLTEVDRDALILYCATFARWRQAERELRKHGMILKSSRNKYPILSPYLSISSRAQAQCRAMLIEFGLTPVSRTRVHLPKQPVVDRDRDRFFGPSNRGKSA